MVATEDRETRPLLVVAEDDADIRRRTVRRLVSRGYDVVATATGLEALAAVRDHQPAAAVLDWIMPGMHGDAICVELRRHEATAGTPIVLLTARTAAADREAGLQAGADVYLCKPADIDELDGVLRRLIAR